MYDPTIGRFLSEDPIGFTGDSSNVYRYVGNVTTMYTDPSGLDANFDIAPVEKPQSWSDWFFRRHYHENYGRASLLIDGDTLVNIGESPGTTSIDGGTTYGDINLSAEFGGGKIPQAVARRAAKLSRERSRNPGESALDYAKRLIAMAQNPSAYETSEELGDRLNEEWDKAHPRCFSTIPPGICFGQTHHGHESALELEREEFHRLHKQDEMWKLSEELEKLNWEREFEIFPYGTSR